MGFLALDRTDDGDMGNILRRERGGGWGGTWLGVVSVPVVVLLADCLV